MGTQRSIGRVWVGVAVLTMSVAASGQPVRHRAPPPAQPPPAQPPVGVSDADALAAARAAGNDSTAIVRALRGHAHSEQSLVMLIAALRSTGDRAGSMRLMHQYVTHYPAGVHVADYARYLENNE